MGLLDTVMLDLSFTQLGNNVTSIGNWILETSFFHVANPTVVSVKVAS